MPSCVGLNKIYRIIFPLLFFSCNQNLQSNQFIDCEWFFVCGKNPLDVSCEFCEFYKINESVPDIGNKLKDHNIDKDSGILCYFINYYEKENKLYFHPKDHDKALTIYFNEFSNSIVCKEYLVAN